VAAPGAPLVFGRETCGDLAAALRREWLVTNGLGGYAFGTLAGINTRRYHGLLVASLAPPVERTVLAASLAEWAVLDGRRYPLSTHEYAGGTIAPHGYRRVQAFALDGMLPAWTYAIEDVLVEKRIWMAFGRNTTYVRYRVVRGDRPVSLEVTPLLTARDFHGLRRRGPDPAVRVDGAGVEIVFDGGPGAFRVAVPGGRFEAAPGWWWNFAYREEAARGLDDVDDLFAPGRFTMTIAPGGSAALLATLEANPDLDADRALAAARERQDALLRRAGTGAGDPMVRQLTLAADQFLVRRGGGMTVLAGYPWFNDWGRDTMIALPGLTLATGRYDDAAAVLRTFAAAARDGLIPNNFPDHAGAEPSYNTADASLWFVLAVYAYAGAAADQTLPAELRPAVREILDRHIAGTRFGIGMDPRDGLLRAGAPGVQLTWMDAKAGDTVVTPRVGKPVEIQALWYNALRAGAALVTAADQAAASRYGALADRALAAFRARFLRPGRDGLADVVDAPEGEDASVRANQLFAVSLPFPLLEGDAAAGVVRSAGRALLTSCGLRSLAPDAPGYHGTYAGDLLSRDRAYHEGTVWAWLIGPYADAYYRVTGDRDAALGLLRPFEQHLGDAGVGSISEIFDGDPPHYPRGCVAQAWSVAEVLRVWRALTVERRR
jgi:predicted glycogen debranching enzyme